MPVAPRLSAAAYGERGLLVRAPGGPLDVARAAEAIRAAEPALDVGAGSHSILVVAHAPIDLLRRAELQASIARAMASVRTGPRPAARRHTVEVVYDGPDLQAVADAAGLPVEAVVRAHSEREVEVCVLGFLPGFAYLGPIDPRLHQPRRPTPRVRVPAGSVGIAGRFTGIYPAASPGGWNLLGRAALSLFDPERDPPMRLQVGDRVQFVAIDAAVGDQRAAELAAARAARAAQEKEVLAQAPRGLEVARVAALATVQDGGRARWLARGVPMAGALDPVALAAANIAVGNDAGAAGIEVAGGGCTLVARGDVLASVDGEPAMLLRDGGTLEVKANHRLCRYLAVRGRIALPEVLGGRGTAVSARLGGLAGRPLQGGDVLPVGDDPGTRTPPHALLPIPGAPSPLVLRLDPLPTDGRLAAGALPALLAGDYQVARASDRTGVRLEGPAIPCTLDEDPGPEPVLPGAVQIARDGQPIVLGPDAAVTGGYPVIGVLRKTSLWSLYRLRPGASIRFART